MIQASGRRRAMRKRASLYLSSEGRKKGSISSDREKSRQLVSRRRMMLVLTTLSSNRLGMVTLTMLHRVMMGERETLMIRDMETKAFQHCDEVREGSRIESTSRNLRRRERRWKSKKGTRSRQVNRRERTPRC